MNIHFPIKIRLEMSGMTKLSKKLKRKLRNHQRIRDQLTHSIAQTPTPRPILIDDTISLFFRTTCAHRKDEIYQIIHPLEDTILDASLAKMKALTSDEIAKQFASIWLEYLSDIDFSIKSILEKKSALVWYMVESRLKPATAHTKNRVTVYLSRKSLRLFILKYGQPDLSGVSFHSDEVKIDELTEDLVLDIYKAERLAHCYYLATSELRMFWKGGPITLPDGIELNTDKDLATAEAIEWMDDRSENSHSFLSSSGGFATIEINYIQFAENSESKEFFIPYRLAAFPNVDHRSPPIFWPGDAKISFVAGSCNYHFAAFDFGSLHRSIEPFNDFLVQTHGFSGTSFVQFLQLFAKRFNSALETGDSKMWLQIHQKGYVISKKSVLLDDIFWEWKNWSKQSKFYFFEKESVLREKIDKIFSTLSCSIKECKNIDPFSRSNIPSFLILEDDYILIDFRNMMFSIDEFILKVRILSNQKQPKAAQKFADNFPIVATTFLRKQVIGLETIWPPNHHLKKNEFECDLNFVHSNVLFMCECKSRLTNIDKLIGKDFKMEDVWKDSLKDLDQVLRLCSYLKDTLSRHRVPENIVYVVPLVIYPNVTWIKTKDNSNCIGGVFPRFTTPDELAFHLNSFGAYPYTKDPLAIRIR